MAADFIVVNSTKPLGARAVQAANLMLQLRAIIDQLVQSANHMNNGVDFSVVEQQFGLQTGTGANFVTLLNIQDAILVGTGGAGGAAQQGQIQEFCARLAGQ